MPITIYPNSLKKRNENGTYSNIVPGIDYTNQIFADIADEYSAQATYAVGDYCIHGGTLYRCTTAISTAEAWTAAHWTPANVGDELTGKVDKVPNKGLSTEDYTAAEKTKLSGIEAQANKTVIDNTLTQTGQAADAKATGDAVDELKNTLNHKADVIYDTASGDIASFPDGADGLPVKDLTVSIEPVQSGTGDPSLTNERPISGWTGANVTRTGKNLFDKGAEDVVLNGYLNSVGEFISSDAGEKCIVSQLLHAGTYTMSKVSTTRFRVSEFLTRSPGLEPISPIRYVDASPFTATSVTITTQESAYLVAYVLNDAGETKTINDVLDSLQIEPGSTATVYEPFGTTIPISWATEAGTVYGGTAEYIGGGKWQVTPRMAKYIITSDMIIANSIVKEGNLWRVYLTSALYDINNTYKNGVCNIATVVTSYSAVDGNNNSLAFNIASADQFLWRNDALQDTTALINAVSNTPIEVAYPLAIPLTPVIVDGIR